MTQYNIHALHPALPFILEYKQDDESTVKTAIVYVNHNQDQVWFPDNPHLDTDEMRRAILAQLDTPILSHEVPDIPLDVLEQIERIRSGREFEGYGHVNF